MLSRLGYWHVTLLLCLTILAPATSATAQASPESYAAALARVRAAPADAEASFLFARLAAERGDFRAAIAALERVLILNPGLANIKLELGVLYLRTGQAALGEAFIRDALKSPDAPPDVRTRGEELLAEAEAGSRPLRFAASISAGLISDSNANSGAAAGTTNNGGVLDPNGIAAPDTSAYLSLTGQVRYDLGLQAGHLLALDTSLYSRAYRDQSELNLLRFSAAPGLDLNLSRVFGRPADLILRYEISALDKGGDRYLEESGVTATLRLATGPRGQLQIGASHFEQDFIPTSAVTANDNRDGKRTGGSISYVQVLNERMTLSMGVDYVAKTAEAGFEAYDDIGGFVSLGVALRPLFGDLGPWRLDVALRAGRREYDAADPGISLTEVQEDTRVGINATLAIPVATGAAVLLEAGHVRNDSNYDIKEYSNTYVSLGIAKRF